MQPNQFEEIKRFRIRVAIFVAILCVVVFVLADRGLWGWMWVVVVIAVPAFVYTAVKSARQIRENRSMSTKEKIKMFLLSSGCIFLAIPLAASALVIALFTICMAH